MLTPQDIAAKQFTVARLGKGYDQVEVDDFLDLITTDYTAALRQVEDLQQRVSARVNGAVTQVLPPVPVTPPAASGGPSLETISLLLQQAEATAAQIKADAQSKADQTVATAQYQANQVTGKAQVDAQGILAQADADAAVVQSKVSELQNVHASVSATLKDALDRLTPAPATEGTS